LTAWHSGRSRPLGAPAGNPVSDPRGVHQMIAASPVLGDSR